MLMTIFRHTGVSSSSSSKLDGDEAGNEKGKSTNAMNKDQEVFFHKKIKDSTKLRMNTFS